MSASAWALSGLGLALLPAPSSARSRVLAMARQQRIPGDRSRRPDTPTISATAVMIICSGVSSTLVFAVGGAVLGLAVLAASVTAFCLATRAVREREARRRATALVTAIRLLVAELEAGATPATAFAAAAEVSAAHRDELAVAAAACARGSTPELTGPDLAPLGHAWQVAAVTGAPVAAAIGRVAADLADRLDHQRAVGVAVAGAQSSALMLAALPVLGVLLGMAMQADPLVVLVATPSGRGLCLIGVLLDCAGVLWTARLTQRAARA